MFGSLYSILFYSLPVNVLGPRRSAHRNPLLCRNITINCTVCQRYLPLFGNPTPEKPSGPHHPPPPSLYHPPASSRPRPRGTQKSTKSRNRAAPCRSPVPRTKKSFGGYNFSILVGGPMIEKTTPFAPEPCASAVSGRAAVSGIRRAARIRGLAVRPPPSYSRRSVRHRSGHSNGLSITVHGTIPCPW